MAKQKTPIRFAIPLIIIALALAYCFGMSGCKGSGSVVDEMTQAKVGEAAPRPTQPVAAVPAPVKYMADWDSQSQGDLWTEYVFKALNELGAPLLAISEVGDAKEYCPRFASLTEAERRQFYIMLISSMARFESGFKPELKYQESFKDSDGRYIISRGLTQMSIESANGYGCKIARAEDLHDPETNLRCTVRVLAKWIPQDKMIGSYGISPKTGKEAHLGGGRYWAVLRKTSESRVRIQAKTKALAFCN